MTDILNLPAEDMASMNDDSKRGHALVLQQQVIDIEQQINELESPATAENRRAEAFNNCQTAISCLSNDVKDALSHLPAYDQRQYSNAIKSLSESLEDARLLVAPKRKFAFKSKPKSSSAQTGGSDANIAIGASQHASMRQPIDGKSMAAADFSERKRHKPVDTLMRNSDLDHVPSISKSSQSAHAIELSARESKWYVEPAASTDASSQVPALITNIEACIMDLSARATRETPLAKVHILAARRSLIICGHISGSTFLSESQGCVLIATCGQLRLHNCIDCVVYLHCTSNPVIEGCNGIKFAHLPAALEQNRTDDERLNQWDQVEDFMWLRPEPSPNWKILPPEETIPDALWLQVVHRDLELQVLDDLLKATHP